MDRNVRGAVRTIPASVASREGGVDRNIPEPDAPLRLRESPPASTLTMRLLQPLDGLREGVQRHVGVGVSEQACFT